MLTLENIIVLICLTILQWFIIRTYYKRKDNLRKLEGKVESVKPEKKKKKSNKKKKEDKEMKILELEHQNQVIVD